MTTTRPARPTDATALAALLDRCSPATRHQRFHGVVTEIPAAYLRRCLSGEHVTRVAQVGAELVGFASAGPVFDEPTVHEVAVLVEDGWQRRGVGRALVLALLADVPVPVVRMELTRSPLLDHLYATLPVIGTASYGNDVTIDIDVAAVMRAVPGPAPRPRCSAVRRRAAAALT
jgi:GNAT superfamily N-acetyltransferase